MWVSFGQSSGPVPDFPPLLLMRKGSLFATRPTLFDYIAERAELEQAAAALFDFLAAGVIDAAPRQTFPLSEARDAHAALESRTTVGSTVLLV
jgi:NADPH2:quinone reductase